VVPSIGVSRAGGARDRRGPMSRGPACVGGEGPRWLYARRKRDSPERGGDCQVGHCLGGKKGSGGGGCGELLWVLDGPEEGVFFVGRNSSGGKRGGGLRGRRGRANALDPRETDGEGGGKTEACFANKCGERGGEKKRKKYGLKRQRGRIYRTGKTETTGVKKARRGHGRMGEP